MKTLIQRHNVNGHNLDIRYNKGKFEFAHSQGTHDNGNFVDRMKNEIEASLREDPDLILFLDLQLDGQRHELDKEDLQTRKQQNEYLLPKLQQEFDKMPYIRDMMFNHADPRWKKHTDWPTLGELQKANQRLVVVTDASVIADGNFGKGRIMHNSPS
ncbi:expressed unknown protein [Seminavis robusta]|uniref:Uncharacterized protein n=1 Tax=Seminavis robusta TaxID=568900 RepID=A0A9N8HKY9_9STRA|nr:expressed unknown protein [Seminavis robusta]|eukprot:Sro769_g199810.1 n/a (157) ;mRNA; r:25761-26231